jgi:hypothetical protein
LAHYNPSFFSICNPNPIGLNWLANLYDQGINGILADEMVREFCVCVSSAGCPLCVGFHNYRVVAVDVDCPPLAYCNAFCAKLFAAASCTSDLRVCCACLQGLGKTIQAISFLAHLATARDIWSASLCLSLIASYHWSSGSVALSHFQALSISPPQADHVLIFRSILFAGARSSSSAPTRRCTSGRRSWQSSVRTSRFDFRRMPCLSSP